MLFQIQISDNRIIDLIRMFENSGLVCPWWAEDELEEKTAKLLGWLQEDYLHDAKHGPIEPALQPSYNPNNVEGMCRPHVFAVHECKMFCRKCGWNPNASETCQTQADESIDQPQR